MTSSTRTSMGWGVFNLREEGVMPAVRSITELSPHQYPTPQSGWLYVQGRGKDDCCNRLGLGRRSIVNWGRLNWERFITEIEEDLDGDNVVLVWPQGGDIREVSACADSLAISDTLNGYGGRVLKGEAGAADPNALAYLLTLHSGDGTGTTAVVGLYASPTAAAEEAINLAAWRPDIGERLPAEAFSSIGKGLWPISPEPDHLVVSTNDGRSYWQIGQCKVLNAPATPPPATYRFTIQATSVEAARRALGDGLGQYEEVKP